MVSIWIAFLSAFAAAISAAPTAIADNNDGALNSTDTLDRNLRNGEIVVFGTGGRSTQLNLNR